MLEVEELTVRYGHVTAVRNVALDVRPGESLALLGPNGAGKSTLLASIAGLLKPACGDITLDGESLVGRAPEWIKRAGVALVPEGRQIFATLSVEENLRLGSTGCKSRAEVKDRIDHALALFPALGVRYKAGGGRLSGGEQQQLAIARALIGQPRLLMLDEPSLGLAPRVVDSVYHTLETLVDDRNLIILVAEQNASRALGFATRSCIIRSGGIAAYGTREELLTQGDLVAAYLGK